MMARAPHRAGDTAEGARRPTPLAILLAAMHALWEAGEVKEAAALARQAAPYLHARRGSVPHRSQDDLAAERLTDAELEAILATGEGGAGARPAEAAAGQPD